MVLAIRSQIKFSGSFGSASTGRVHTTDKPLGKECVWGIINKLIKKKILWSSSLLYNLLLSALGFFLYSFPAHSITEAHIFDFDP